jgi:cytochrome c oxidase subunit 1/cytochrome c oxidase subunit I+III
MSISEYERVPIIRSLAEDPDLPARLKALWATKPGLYGWISSVDHKSIGIRYLVTSFVFLVLGGLEALLMRMQSVT